MQESTQITVKREWVDKAREQAYQMRKPYYMIALSFGDDKDYFLLDQQILEDLYSKAQAMDKVYEAMNTEGLRAEGLEDEISEIISKIYPG